MENEQVVKENKISEESAEAQVDKLIVSYDINAADLVVESGEDWLLTILNRLKRAVMAGNLEISDKGELTQHLVYPTSEIKTISYRRMNPIALMERGKAKDEAGRNYAIPASLSNLPVSTFLKFDIVDASLAQRFGQLFMVM